MPYYPPTGGSYPYSAYHPPNSYNTQHVQTPGAYPASAYQTPYPTAVQGYGAWPYTAYSYYAPQQQQQQQQAAQQQAKPQPVKPPVKASTPAPTTAAPVAPVSSTSAATPTTAIPPTAAYAPPQSAYSMTAPTTSTISAGTSSIPRPYTSTYTYVPSYRDTVAAASSGGARGSSKKSSFRGLFTKELRNLMYGFGDDRNPANDTVNVMEEILVEYIVDVCQSALAPGKKARLSIEDLRRALSRPADAKKLARMEELLFMQEDIKRARAQFEESDMNQANYQA